LPANRTLGTLALMENKLIIRLGKLIIQQLNILFKKLNK